MRLFSCLVLLALTQTLSSQRITIYFDTNQAEITAENRQSIQSFFSDPANMPAADGLIRVIGYADPRGAEKDNLDLSRRRAEAVAREIRQLGPGLGQVMLEARGESQSALEGLEDLAASRRVDIIVWRGRNACLASPKELPFKQQSFEATKGLKTIFERSGTRLAIPPNSLVHADGSLVSGPVELQYREFRDLADFAVFGLPMHFSDVDGDYFFRSSGMFELRVLQGKEELQLAPGKRTDINFQRTAGVSHSRVFRFEEKTGQWVKAEDPWGFKDTFAPDPDPNNADKDCIPEAPGIYPGIDTKPEKRFTEAIQTGYDIAFGQDSILYERARAEAEGWRQPAQAASPSGTILQRATGTRDEYAFSVIDAGVPELKIFQSLRFRCKAMPDSLLNKSFNLVRMAYNYETDVFHIQFSTWPQYTEIAGLQLLDAKGKAIPVEKSKSIALEYRRRYDSRRRLEDTWPDFLAILPLFKQGKEQCMNNQQWLAYFFEVPDQMRARFDSLLRLDYKNNPESAKKALEEYNDARAKRLRSNYAQMPGQEAASKLAGITMESLTWTLSLDNFGIYNCDQLYRLGEGTITLATAFFTPEGRRIQSVQTNQLERKTQLFITTFNPGQMYYNPKRPLDIILTGADSRLYYLPAKEYAAMNLVGKSSCKLTVRDVTDQVQTAADWRKLLAL